MTYYSWLDTHNLKHKNIINKLSHLSDEEIIEYFDYENMKLKEKEFCILYKDNKKCHDTEKLNCYLCGCPNFRIDKTKSFCSINSKYGGKIETKDFTHQDCSKCKVPHSVPYIKKHFNKNWSSIMSECIVS